MLYLINDTSVSITDGKAFPSAQGGSASFLAGFINHLFKRQKPFGLIGNFDPGKSQIVRYTLKTRSNLVFLLKLASFFLFKRFSDQDIFYFQRPDHLSLSWFSPAKKVLHLHGSMRLTMKVRRGLFSRSVYFFMEERAMQIADLIITTDYRTAALYAEVYPFSKCKMHILPAGMDFKFFSEFVAEPQADKQQKPIRLIYAGRLAYPKRLSDVVVAFAMATRQIPYLEIHIAGDGNLLPEIRQLVASKGLQVCVFFHGILPKEKLRALIHTCDAGILLSHSEGSPVSLKEILACGKPVIANNVGDVTDYVIDKVTGFIVDPSDHEQVANAIINAIEKSKEMSKDCISKARAYDEMIVNEKIFQLIREYENDGQSNLAIN